MDVLYPNFIGNIMGTAFDEMKRNNAINLQSLVVLSSGTILPVNTMPEIAG
jgi:hypothetical protein